MNVRADAIRPAPVPGWIGGPLFDLCFFFGSAVVALAAGLLMLTVPAAVLPVWFVWIWLLEGPHLFATWQRTYLDAEFRRQRPRLLLNSLAWLLPGPLCLLASRWFGQPGIFLLFLGAAALWSVHHSIRQYHGLLSIYQRLGQAGERDRRLDRVLLHAVLWGIFGLFQIVHPANRVLWQWPVEPGPAGRALIAALSSALALALVYWAGLLVQRWRQGRVLKPGVFALVVAVGTTLFSVFVVGLREPLLAGAATPEEVFLAATAVSGILHGMHYLGIVMATSRRRTEPPGTGWAARLRHAPLQAYLLMVVLSLFYVGLNLLRGMPLGLAPGSTAAQVFLALYWGLFLHHYWLDQKIWRPSTDARLRTELGLANP